jgi:hypothetical protein
MRDSSASARSKSAGWLRKIKSLDGLIEKQCGPIHSGVSCSGYGATSIKDRSRHNAGVLIEEKHVSAAAFVLIKVERVKVTLIPTRSAISADAKQRLKDGILPANKRNSRTQHLRAWETAAKESALTDLP